LSTVVDENGRASVRAMRCAGVRAAAAGGPVTMNIVMPNREGCSTSWCGPAQGDDRASVLARQPITISATPAPAQGQDALPTVAATFRLPPEVPQSDVTWQALPLDPDMASGPWTPTDTGPAVTGTFEPGNWRVTATAPGEVTLSADVAIFPGQANEFTVQIDASGEEDHGALDLQGPWRILTVPPHDAPPGSPIDPMKIMDVVLEINAAADGYQGRFTPAPATFGTVLFEREIDSVVEEDGALILTMALPMVDPAPFVLSVVPFAEGYAGTLVAGANSLPVVFWPGAVPLPPAARLQVQLHGPRPDDQGLLRHGVETVFACAQSVCAWTDPASGLTLPLPMGWSVTAPEFETASATPTETDLPSLSLFGPEGQELRLNPRQWVDSNGTCHETRDLGRLCHFADADVLAAMTAVMIAPMIERRPPAAGAQMRPVRLSLPGVARDAVYELEITLVTGEDARHADGQQFLGAMSLEDRPLGVGNVYDVRATLQGRDYHLRTLRIEPGDTAQDVVLPPVYLWDEVTLALPETPIVAGTGGFFPVLLTAPEGFTGSVAVHDADDRDAPALFAIGGAQMLDAQDQVLPVPDLPGFYEVRFLDMMGEMFGGTEFEAVAAPADAPEIRITPIGTTQFGTGCFISAALTGPEGPDYTMIAPVTASRAGQDLRGVTDPEAPLVFEIHSFGSTGESLRDLMLLAPCAEVALAFGTPECRYREGDGVVARDCPAPVVFAPMQMGDG
jgi:hypothetical protein